MTEEKEVQTKSLVGITFKSGFKFEAWFTNFTTEVFDGKVTSVTYSFFDKDQSIHHMDLSEIALIAVKKKLIIEDDE